MAEEPRLTQQSLKVLRVFMSSPLERQSGAEISRRTKLKSGTLYPILARFETAGWLESAWEDVDASQIGRPRRRLYKITNFGQSAALAAFSEIGFPLEGGLAWAG